VPLAVAVFGFPVADHDLPPVEWPTKPAGSSFLDYFVAGPDREASARKASGAELRMNAAGFPARKTPEDFDWDAQPTARQQGVARFRGFLLEAQNVVLLGSPGTGKTHLAVANSTACNRAGLGHPPHRRAPAKEPPPRASPPSPPRLITADEVDHFHS
jgi:hypothetical protein